jgi:hypothetical protein
MAWLFARMVLKARVSGVAYGLLALALQDMHGGFDGLTAPHVVHKVSLLWQRYVLLMLSRFVERLLSGACLHSFALYTMFVTNVCQRVSAR